MIEKSELWKASSSPKKAEPMTRVFDPVDERWVNLDQKSPKKLWPEV
jgi:hypothetical protein